VPCYYIQVISLNLEVSDTLALMAALAEILGERYATRQYASQIARDGEIQLPSDYAGIEGQTVAQIKRAYAKHVLLRASSKFGWQARSKGGTGFTVTRRGADAIDVDILEDGRVKVTTNEISAGNHRAADGMLALLGKLMGGNITRDRNKRTKTRTGIRAQVAR